MLTTNALIIQFQWKQPKSASYIQLSHMPISVSMIRPFQSILFIYITFSLIHQRDRRQWLVFFVDKDLNFGFRFVLRCSHCFAHDLLRNLPPVNISWIHKPVREPATPNTHTHTHIWAISRIEFFPFRLSLAAIIIPTAKIHNSNRKKPVFEIQLILSSN